LSMKPKIGKLSFSWMRMLQLAVAAATLATCFLQDDPQSKVFHHAPRGALMATRQQQQQHHRLQCQCDFCRQIWQC